MLPLAKAFVSPRNPQTPAPSEQDRAPRLASPGDAEAWRLRFRQFQYHVAGGPHLALGQLWTLCRQWLQPEMRSKEEMLELLVLEQFLGALPSKMRTWVQSQAPRTCREAASLVEDLTQMSQQEVLVSLTNHQDGSIGKEEDEKSPRSQRDPSQASELGPSWEGEWQLQQRPHTRAATDAPCTLGSLGPQPPSVKGLAKLKADRQRMLERGVPGGAGPGPAQSPPKPSIWDEPPCGPAGDRARDRRAEGGAPGDTVLRRPGGQGPAPPSPAPRPAAGPAAPSARSSPPAGRCLGGGGAGGAQPGAPSPAGGRPFACAACGAAFAWVTPFMEHQRGHGGEGALPAASAPRAPRAIFPPGPPGRRRRRGPERPFACGDCGRAFPRAVQLADHRRLHAP